MAKHRRQNGTTSTLHTFLLADLREYTRYTVEHGDQAAAALAQRFESISRRVVTEHGGTVYGTAGDQILAVFSSARAALTASLALQAAFRPTERAAKPIEAGIGLDAGEAVAVGEGYRGGALNLAARLCSLAAAGEVLASEAVTHLAGAVQGVTYTDRGMAQLKGFRESIRVVSIAGPLDPSSSRDRTAPAVGLQRNLPMGGFLGALPASPMVAREEEMARILRVGEVVSGGSGQLVMLVGEPGVGKTRLAQEVNLRLRNRSFLVATGRCYEPQRTVPFYPFLEALATLYASCPADIREEVPKRWPRLVRLLPEHDLPSPPPSEERERLFRTLGSFLCAVSVEQPLALMVDDLHWADGASIDLLQHLARQTRGNAVLLLGTYRDVEMHRHGYLANALRDLQREQLVERVPVQRLGLEGTREQIAATLEANEISPELVDVVHRSTEGNPFFTNEVLRALVERGALRPDGGIHKSHRAAPHSAGMVVPESVREAIEERLSRLTEQAQEALGEASVLGPTFRFQDLQQIGARSEADLEAALQEATAAGLVQEVELDRYSFDHVLTQEALYGRLSARRKRRLHLATAEGIERLTAMEAMAEGQYVSPTLEAISQARSGGRVPDLARHYLRAGRADRALLYVLIAGDQAQEVSAYEEAAAQYRTALTIARDVGDRQRELQALERLGESLRVSGRHSDALSVLGQALALARQRADREGEYRIAARMGWAHAGALSAETGIALLEPIAAELLPSGERPLPSPGLGAVHAALARLYMITLRDHDMLAAASRAVSIARSVGDQKLMTSAQALLADAMNRCAREEDEKGASRAAYEEAIRLAEQSGDEETLCRCLNNLGNSLCFEVGDLGAATRLFERGLVLAQRRRAPEALILSQTKLASARFFAGKWLAARDLLNRARALADETGSLWVRLMVLSYSAGVDMAVGRFDAANADLEQMAALARQSGDREYMAGAAAALADCDLLQGRPAAALARIDQLSDEMQAQMPILATTVAEVRLRNGLIDEAVQGSDQAVAEARRRGEQWPLRSALRVQGMIRSQQGRPQEARAAYEEALSLTPVEAFPYEAAQIVYELGRLLLRSGDIDEGRRRLEEALAVFERLGAEPYRSKAERELAAV